MKAAIYVLSVLTLILVGVVAALWLQPALFMAKNDKDVRFGLYEGCELVGKVDDNGRTAYIVENENGEKMFNVPVRNCILDVRFRNGCLRFRENVTGREGYIDKNGIVTFFNDKALPSTPERKGEASFRTDDDVVTTKKEVGNNAAEESFRTIADLRKVARNNPFYEEANKVLSGKLEESDAEWRRVILNYCEHLRVAYTTKDIDFIKQVFSDNALIIVGSVVKAAPADDGYTPDKRVTYYLRTKKEYVSRLSKAFAANKKINVKFSDFRIMRHPTMKGIYGVSLRQCYTSDRYADDGWLFLLWDFRDRSMPRIHVRTWQPADDVKDGEIINIGDFNLQ